MIDFVRIHYKDKSNIEPFVLKEKNFNKLTTSLDYHTSEIKYPYKTKVESMEIVINEKSAYVKNSLHKFKNALNTKANHNYNDFYFSELCTVINYLTKKIIDLDVTEITQLEFGLNIKTKTSAERIINNSFLMHKHVGYNHNKKFNGKGAYKQFDHSNYFIKVYDKAKQYKRHNENILRFEIKFIKKVEFRKLGIKNISDLKSKDNLKNLFDYLIKRFDELNIVDEYESNSAINIEERQQLDVFTNVEFWNKLSNRKLRNKKAFNKMKFNELLIKYNLLKTKSELKQLLQNKFKELLNN